MKTYDRRERDNRHYRNIRKEVLQEVLTKPHQFVGYSPNNPITDEILAVVEAALEAWARGEAAPALPPYANTGEYLYFTGARGDGRPALLRAWHTTRRNHRQGGATMNKYPKRGGDCEYTMDCPWGVDGWCDQRDIRLDAVNDNLQEMKDFFGNDTRKVFANEYWDDRARLMPPHPPGEPSEMLVTLIMADEKYLKEEPK